MSFGMDLSGFDAAELQGMGFSPVGGSSSSGGNANSASVGSSTAAGNTAASAGAAPVGGLDAFNAADYGLGGGKTAALDKFAGILQSGGALSENQQAKLDRISDKTGIDFSGMFSGFGGGNAASGGLDTLGGATTGGGMVDNPWTASAGDLYQNLSPAQETKFGKIAGQYASSLAGGDPLKEGKLDKLDKFLNMAGLGTRESYFAQPTYTGTTPESFATKTGGAITYEDLAKLYTTADPMLVYAASQKYGITPEEIQEALGGYSKSYYAPSSMPSDISSLLAAGQSDYQDLQLAIAYYKNPDNPMFEDPAVRSRAEAALYTYQNPIQEPTSATATNRRGETIAGSNQYGTYNNAPILSTEIFNSIIGDRNRIGSDAMRSDLLDQLGWNFKSGEGLNLMQKGVRVVGLNEKQFTPDVLAAMDRGARQVDESTGVEYDPYQNQRELLGTAAERLGIDPAQYESSADLYGAVERATQGLYQVIGGYKNQWGDTAANLDDRGNHANVIYRDVNGQLIPIAADLFKYERPKSSIIGGTVGEILGSVPFIPEIVGFATGNPYVYAGLKGAQTASRPGADFGDVAVSTALAYYTPTVAKEISSVIGNFLPAEFVSNNPMLADYITKAGTNISMNLAISALRGQDIDIGELIANTLAGSAIQVGAGEALKLTDFPPDMQRAISQVIARVAMGGDIQSAVTNAIARVGVNALRNRGSSQISGATQTAS